MRFLLFFVVFLSQRANATPNLPLEVFFNFEAAHTYKDPYRGFQRAGNDIERIWVDQIDAAEARIEIAVYELRLPQIALALVRAKNRGVQIKIVLENQNNFSIKDLPHEDSGDESDLTEQRIRDYYAYVDTDGDKVLSNAELAERDAIWILQQAHVPIIDDRADGSKGSGLMHHKFMIVDSQIVMTGSGNLTWSDFHGDALEPKSLGNRNNFILIREPKVAKVFADEFDQLWGDGPGGLSNSRFGVKKKFRPYQEVTLNSGERIGIQFGAVSKTQGYASSINGKISSLLGEVSASLKAALFVWSEQELADALERGSRSNNRDIRVLIEPFFGYRYYSELLDLLGVQMLGAKCVFEPKNKPWSHPIQSAGIPRLTPGDFLHDKFAVIDHRTVITGSHNWSAAANQLNDETLVVIHSPQAASIYGAQFDQLAEDAEWGVTFRLRQKIKEAEIKCQTWP